MNDDAKASQLRQGAPGQVETTLGSRPLHDSKPVRRRIQDIIIWRTHGFLRAVRGEVSTSARR
jgi:hypothetical protein